MLIINPQSVIAQGPLNYLKYEHLFAKYRVVVSYISIKFVIKMRQRNISKTSLLQYSCGSIYVPCNSIPMYGVP